MKYEFKDVDPIRSKTMKAIKGKDTRIELKLRKELWKHGIRGYRVNYKKVIGKPDIAFVGKKIAIFCDSEFWHGKDWDEQKNKIKTNREYWIPKIERNIERDKEVNEELKQLNWTVLRFWGKEILKDIEKVVVKIKKHLNIKD